MQSKSWLGSEAVCIGNDTVSSKGRPNPAASNVVMIEVSPKIVLSSFGFSPIPGFFEGKGGSVHVWHVES